MATGRFQDDDAFNLATGLLSGTTITTTIVSFPVEMILKIMKISIRQRDHCTAICLGLAHPKLYQALKILYPQPIPLSHRTCPSNGQGSSGCSEDQFDNIVLLDNLIRDLFPSQYRLSGCHTKANGVYFLRKDLYGERFGYRELRLRERYEDYELMTFSHKGTRYHLLENPYNVGDQWYAGAYKLMEQREFPGWSAAVKKFWEDRVEKTHLHRRCIGGNSGLLLSFW